MMCVSSWRARFTCAALLLSPALSACSSQRPPLYYWPGYQEQVYSSLSQKADPAKSIAVLEEGLAKAQSRNQIPAPGYYAQLGYLYAQIGRADQARSSFEKEKSLFPESAHYMDMLLRSMAGGTAPSGSPTPATSAPLSSSPAARS